MFNPGNLIGGGSPNTIAFNKANGVLVEQADSLGNKVLSNSIFSNGKLGIDLGGDGASANDTGDDDPGSNNLQNKPVLTSARTSGKPASRVLYSIPAKRDGARRKNETLCWE